MPAPALLLAALPYLGTAAAAFAGKKLADLTSGDNMNQSMMPSANQKSGSFWSGTPGQTMTFQKYTPEQQQAFSQILQASLGSLGKMNTSFNPIEAQARKGFNEQAIPSIAERFTSMGEGAQRSSAFPQILGQAGAGLETNLAAMKSMYGMDQQKMLMSLLGLGLQPQFESAYSPRQPGFAENAGSAFLSALPMIGASYFMR